MGGRDADRHAVARAQGRARAEAARWEPLAWRDWDDVSGGCYWHEHGESFCGGAPPPFSLFRLLLREEPGGHKRSHTFFEGRRAPCWQRHARRTAGPMMWPRARAARASPGGAWFKGSGSPAATSSVRCALLPDDRLTTAHIARYGAAPRAASAPRTRLGGWPPRTPTRPAGTHCLLRSVSSGCCRAVPHRSHSQTAQQLQCSVPYLATRLSTRW